MYFRNDSERYCFTVQTQDSAAVQINHAGKTGMILTLSMLSKNFSRQHLEIFFFNFSQNKGFETSCKLSPLETTCMKCQSPFVENKENISIFPSAEFVQRVVIY